jgi:hypothetical protein
MAITKEQITFTKRGGIYYTDQVNFADNDTSLACEKLVFTATEALIDTRIDQTSARHLKRDVVIVRGRK